MSLLRLVACRLKARKRVGTDAISLASKVANRIQCAPGRKPVRGYSLDERLASRDITQRSR